MKVYQYFNMFLCSLIVFVFLFVISNNFGISLFISFILFFVFVFLKKKMIEHDTKVEMRNIEKYFNDKNND